MIRNHATPPLGCTRLSTYPGQLHQEWVSKFDTRWIRFKVIGSPCTRGYRDSLQLDGWR